MRVVEIEWDCHAATDLVAFDHTAVDGVVSINVALPACARFDFFTNRFNQEVASRRLSRSNALSYELPEVTPIKPTKWWPWRPNLFHLGRRITVHVRPNGPARFVIGHGAPSGIAWFDTLESKAADRSGQ